MRRDGMKKFAVGVLLGAMIVLELSVTLPAKEDVVAPKEYGVYVVKMPKTQKRLLPNMLFDEKGILYVESNNPQRFLLAEIEVFVLYGTYDIKYLTLNPLLFANESPMGRSRFILGKDVELEVTKKSDLLYTVKPKGLFGRGYYGLWINDTVWDFVVE
jgi:hypothetical protein